MPDLFGFPETFDPVQLTLPFPECKPDISSRHVVDVIEYAMGSAERPVRVHSLDADMAGRVTAEICISGIDWAPRVDVSRYICI